MDRTTTIYLIGAIATVLIVLTITIGQLYIYKTTVNNINKTSKVSKGTDFAFWGKHFRAWEKDHAFWAEHNNDPNMMITSKACGDLASIYESGRNPNKQELEAFDNEFKKTERSK